MNSQTLLVSDLHLSDGGALEDFSLDEAFGQFLQYYNDGKTRLILNGDTFDFLQTQPLGAMAHAAAPAKVHSVCAAHPAFIESLAAFTRCGNSIDLVEGNHDIEFVFPEVKGALREELLKCGGDADRLCFPQSIVTDIEGIHIEHGHQVDPLNCFDYERLIREQKTGLLQYPWGSHFVMRVFNAIEPEYRFIDKVRPESAAAVLLYLLDRELFRANVPSLLGLKVEGWLTGLRLADAAQPIGKGSHKGNEAVNYSFAQGWHEILENISLLESSGADWAATEKKGALEWVLRKVVLSLNRRWEAELDRYRAYDFLAAEEIAARTAKRMVIFGHTHHMAHVALQSGAQYINSGTWTPLLQFPAEENTAEWMSKARQRESYPVVNRPSYVHIENSGAARLMTWNVENAVPVSPTRSAFKQN